KASRGALDAVFDHLAAERIAVDAQLIGGLRQAPVALADPLRNKPLFELADGVVEADALVHHFLDKLLQAFANHVSSCPVRRRNASTYFSRVFMTTSSGSEGTGGCLFHLIASR